MKFEGIREKLNNTMVTFIFSMWNNGSWLGIMNKDSNNRQTCFGKITNKLWKKWIITVYKKYKPINIEI